MQNLGEVGSELAALMAHYDKEGEGALDSRVVKAALLQNFPFLTRLQVNALLTGAPADSDGRILWRDFLPKMTSTVRAMGDPAAIRERAELRARAEFQPVELMNGRDQESVQAMMRTLFAQADADGNGVLDADEFRRCLASAELGLTPWEVDDLMDSFDADGDGNISYEEFTHLAYEVLLSTARERAIQAAMIDAEAQLEAELAAG